MLGVCGDHSTTGVSGEAPRVSTSVAMTGGGGVASRAVGVQMTVGSLIGLVHSTA